MGLQVVAPTKEAAKELREARELGRQIDAANLAPHLPLINASLDKMLEQALIEVDKSIAADVELGAQAALEILIQIATIRSLQKRINNAAKA